MSSDQDPRAEISYPWKTMGFVFGVAGALFLYGAGFTYQDTDNESRPTFILMIMGALLFWSSFYILANRKPHAGWYFILTVLIFAAGYLSFDEFNSSP